MAFSITGYKLQWGLCLKLKKFEYITSFCPAARARDRVYYIFEFSGKTKATFSSNIKKNTNDQKRYAKQCYSIMCFVIKTH